jgi:hypothetical protein|tara:strand:+ start:344 stop:520 length:177 start_codon:yes stop_codon:yes gene_type:complete
MGKEIMKWMQVEENKKMLVDSLVKNTDIPMLSEKVEEKVYSAIIYSIASILEKAFQEK